MLSRRNLKFINQLNKKKWITSNKTIIDYAMQYVKREESENGEIEAINHVRMYK